MLLRQDQLFPWTAHGYAAPVPKPTGIEPTVLTPRSTVAAIRAGYIPRVEVDKGDGDGDRTSCY